MLEPLRIMKANDIRFGFMYMMIDSNLGRHAYVCVYNDWHGLVEKVYSRVKLLTLHPTDGALYR